MYIINSICPISSTINIICPIRTHYPTKRNRPHALPPRDLSAIFHIHSTQGTHREQRPVRQRYDEHLLTLFRPGDMWREVWIEHGVEVGTPAGSHTLSDIPLVPELGVRRGQPIGQLPLQTLDLCTHNDIWGVNIYCHPQWPHYPSGGHAPHRPLPLSTSLRAVGRTRPRAAAAGHAGGCAPEPRARPPPISACPPSRS